MLSQAPRKRSNQAKLMLGTSVGIKTLAQARFHTASFVNSPAVRGTSQPLPISLRHAG